MSDLTASIEDGREVSELKVVELREELGKRNLSKTGNKKELADRLRGFLLTGSGETSDKSTPNSPVKSPVNNLIAQYRSTQQQILKDVHKDTEPTKVEETPEPQQGEAPNAKVGAEGNGQREAEEIKAHPSEQADEPSTKVEEVPDEPTPAEEQSHPPEVPQNSEKVIEEIPKPQSPVGGDRTRSSTPEREIKTPVKVVSEEKDDQAISDEEEDEKEATPEKAVATEIQQVSDDEGEVESPPQSPKKPREEVRYEQKENGNKKELNGEEEEAQGDDDKRKQSPSDEESKRKSIVYTEGIVYVKDEPLQRKASTVSQVEEDRTPEGFLRSKAVSPARDSPTNIIHVRGMKRPFNLNQWNGVLSKFGTVDLENDVWLNNLKSESIVRFATVEEAKSARDGIHHILWPEGNGCELLVSFTDEELFIERKGVIRKVIKHEDSRNNGRDEVRVGKKREKSLSPMQEELPTLKDVRRERRRTELEDDEEPVPKKKKESKNLEDLFRKTAARPHLYYLPLSDEEAARRQAEKAIQKREAKEPSPKAVSKRRSQSPPARSKRSQSPPPAKRQRSRSRSPIRRGRSRSPIRRGGGRRNSPPPRRGLRSPRRSSPPSKRRSPSPPSRSKPSKPSASPPPRRRSPASPIGKK